MESLSIGLDIGSSAVRAAEIEIAKDGRRILRRFAQVGLPHGYVVDGEVNNIPGVTAALRRLWTEGGFSTTKVVLGVSGPRVFVRQADVPALGAEDLRSSLKFDAQEMIPIPMEEASFDFSVLDEAPQPRSDGQPMQRILLVAAHRDLLRSYMATLKAAGLTAVAMDAAPLALLRAVPSSRDAEGVEVLVSIGAELTTVAVREAGVPRFIRSLTVGGAKLTETIANNMHLEMAAAERLKRGAVPPGSPQFAQARKAMSADMRDLAEDVRATIDFFLSQASGPAIDRLFVTGGAAQTEGLANAVAGSLPTPVITVDPFAGLQTSGLGYDAEQMKRAAAGAATAVGLALWSTEAPLIRLSVLPEEVAAARRARRLFSLAVAGVAGVAVVLGVAAAGQILDVHSAQNRVHSAERQVATLNGQVTKLQKATAVHSQVAARVTLVSNALQGDVDWVRVIGQLAAVMPPDLSLTSFTGARTNIASGTTSSSQPGTGIGTVTFDVTGTGGLPAVSAWLQGLQSDPDFQGVWISGVNVKDTGGTVQFSSNAYLTPVSQSNRAKEVGK